MNPTVTSYAALALAIVAEVIATSVLPHTREFTRPWPTLLVAVLYATAFYLLTIVTRAVPIGIAYALWSGFGIVLIAAVNWLIFRQRLDTPAIIGLGLLISGIVVINVFSKTVSH
jgi:small multidrug resistance pump